jgi:predicted DCC family thiol-disulfide oxidoreductase YuxK
MLGCYLFITQLLAYRHAQGVATAVCLSAAAGISLFLVVGFKDRAAALALAALGVLPVREGLIPPVHALLFWFLLTFQALAPPAPYGSIDRRADDNPGTDWKLPPIQFALAWTVLTLGHGVAGIVWHGSAVEATAGFAAAAVAAFLPQHRRWAWVGVSTALAVGFILGEAEGPWLLLHFITFDPAWIKPKPKEGVDSLFYDGHCGLCHRTVRFVLAEDTRRAFRFAPLQGPSFYSRFSSAEREVLPDSVVVKTSEGKTLVRGRAAKYLLQRLGGLWRAMGAALSLVPDRWLDAAYDQVARVRHRLFDKPNDACPILPRELRDRFDA